MTHNYFMATQDHVARLTEIGERVLADLQPVIDMLYPDGPPDALAKGQTIGRELGMALMLAGRGDHLVNRTAMIEGLGHAIGECIAQQPPASGAGIRVGLTRGLAEGLQAASATFVAGGRG